MPASQTEEFSRLCCPGVVSESPTKTAIVKRELTLTRPSNAVTWTLVVDDEEEDVRWISSLLLRPLKWSFGYASDLVKKGK